MANIYVRSTDGSDSDNGSTWALAKATVQGAAAIAALGDVVCVSHNHAESAANVNTWNFPGTAANPTKILCVNDGAEPPTALATTATVSSTTGSIALGGSGSFYCYGITFQNGTAASASNGLTLFAGGAGSAVAHFDTCTFKQLTTGSSGAINVGTSTGNCLTLDSCDFFLNLSTQTIQATGGVITYNGGSILSGSAASVGAFRITGLPIFATYTGFDFSNFGGTWLFDVSNLNADGKILLRDCYASPGQMCATTNLGPNLTLEIHNSSSSSDNFQYTRQTYGGLVTIETTKVMTGGASDGTTPIAWKMVSGANNTAPQNPFYSGEMQKRITTIGSPITVTVEVLTNNITLTNDHAYLDLWYLGASGNPKATRINDWKASVLASSANQTSSSATWTTTGITPIKQKLEVTFTPQMIGVIIGRVTLNRASTTMYVNPQLIVT